MYCVKCGVRLADTENTCPLCGTKVYHPDISRPETAPLFPNTNPPERKVKRWSVMLVLTILYFLPILVCLTCDFSLNGRMEWSGYVIGSLVLAYSVFMMPAWFHKPNPVIFTPSAFAVAALFLLYICLHTGGAWYLSFALPVTAAVCLIVTSVVTLCRYIRRGRLYIYGGAVLALGALGVLIECLLRLTFDMSGVGYWSVYPLISLTILGLAIIATAIFRPIRELLEKKFFI